MTIARVVIIAIEITIFSNTVQSPFQVNLERSLARGGTNETARLLCESTSSNNR